MPAVDRREGDGEEEEEVVVGADGDPGDGVEDLGMTLRRRIPERNRVIKGGDLGSGRGWRVVLLRDTWRGIGGTTEKRPGITAAGDVISLVGVDGLLGPVHDRRQVPVLQVHDMRAQGSGQPVAADRIINTNLVFTSLLWLVI